MSHSLTQNQTMPIAKGEPWGSAGPLPEGLVRCPDDAAVADRVWRDLEHGLVPPPVAVESGDLLRTVGGMPAPSRSADVMLLPIDLCLATIDGATVPIPFVAHCIVRRRWWHGEGAAAMNAAWLGSWYLGPRSHPNDGLLDVTVGSLPLRQRWEARKRAALGTHLPHPQLRTKRISEWSHEFDRPTPLWLDGRARGVVEQITVSVRSDAFTLVV